MLRKLKLKQPSVSSRLWCTEMLALPLSNDSIDERSKTEAPSSAIWLCSKRQSFGLRAFIVDVSVFNLRAGSRYSSTILGQRGGRTGEIGRGRDREDQGGRSHSGSSPYRSHNRRRLHRVSFTSPSFSAHTPGTQSTTAVPQTAPAKNQTPPKYKNRKPVRQAGLCGSRLFATIACKPRKTCKVTLLAQSVFT